MDADHAGVDAGSSTTTAADGRSKRRLDIERGSGEGDIDVGVDDKYDYVHPSIRNVLKMKPRNVPLDFLESECVDFKNDDAIMVDADDCTIKWKVLEKFIENENSKKRERESQVTISMEQLVTLASQCDSALFRGCKLPRPVVPSPILGLLRIIPEEYRADQQHRINEEGGAYYLVATLLALNMVENSIRHLIGKKNGKAPLLKDMIEIMAVREGENALPKSLISVSRTLLLPINGLNLRNLIWHGFLPAIPRRWLALSVVLVLSLDELAGSSSFDASSFDGNPNIALAAMRKHKALVAILDHGEGIFASPEKLCSLERRMIQSNIISRSHTELLMVCFKFVHKPIIFASVAGPLIEHLLRLMWCHENKQNKYIAEPGSYYVTLDGHGQKDKHEIVVLPYFCQQGVSKVVRNQLVYRLGGSTMALLMDMFTSPSGGPNIRATVAHGSFNEYLFEELVALEREKDGMGGNGDELKDMTSALLSILSSLCEDRQYAGSETDNIDVYKRNASLGSYKPCFSYSALLLSEVGSMTNSMKSFYNFIRIGHHLKYSMSASQSQMQIEISQKVSSMSPSFGSIIGMQKRICQNFGMTESNFTDESFFQETSYNLIASECGAAKLLLSEISEAANSSLWELNAGITAFQSGEIELSSRRRKQVSRICATAQLTLDFYSFAAYCALLYIERRQETANACKNMEFQKKMDLCPTNDELFIAVKRSRMVVSTFSTAKSFDRALSALAQYTAGKAVKAVSEIV